MEEEDDSQNLAFISKMNVYLAAESGHEIIHVQSTKSSWGWSSGKSGSIS